MTVAECVRTVVSILALLVACAAAYFAWRSSRAARDSAKNSKVSAENSGRSAGTAAESLRRQGQQEHDRLAPVRPNPPLMAFLGTAAGHQSWFVTVRFNRDYRVKGIRRYRPAGTAQATSEANLPFVVRAGQEYKFEVEPHVARRPGLEVQEVEFRLWPPEESDDVAPWLCPCGKSGGVDDVGRERGHWSFVMPVRREDGSR